MWYPTSRELLACFLYRPNQPYRQTPAIWYLANRNERRIIACDSSPPERSVQLAKEKPKIALAVFKSHNSKDSLWVAVDGEVWE